MRARDLAALAGCLPVVIAIAMSGSAIGAPADRKPAPSASAPDARKPAKPAARPRDRATLDVMTQALADHQASNFGQAVRKLEQTIGKCGADACSPAVKARALVALGLVREAGLRKHTEAVSAFEQALRLDDRVELPAQADAETRRVFGEVRERVIPAPPPPPPQTSASPAASSSPPPPAEVPVAPLQTLGDATWKEGIGLVREGDAPPAPPADQGWGRPIALSAPRPVRFDEFEFQLRLGKVTFNPINDGKTDSGDATDLSGALIELMFRPEWRSASGPVAFWFDFRFGITPRVSGPLQMPNRTVVKPIDAHLTHIRLSGHLGLDAVPVSFVGFGPFFGYRGDAFSLSLDDGDKLVGTSTESGSYGSFDHGMEYGGHVRLRTADRVGRPAILYADAAMFHRRSPILTGVYQRLELGIRPGGGTVLGLWYERRSSAKGYAAIGEVDDPADILGRTMAVESIVGIGLGTAFSTVVDAPSTTVRSTTGAPRRRK